MKLLCSRKLAEGQVSLVLEEPSICKVGRVSLRVPMSANQLTDMQQYILKLESTYFCDLTDTLDADGVPRP